MGFQFSNKGQKEIEVLGKKYKVQIDDPEMIDGFNGFSKKYEGINPSEYEPGQLVEIYDDFKKAIDLVLGDGSTDQIFKGRRKSFFDMLELYGYLSDEINASEIDAYLEEVTSKYYTAEKTVKPKK